MAAITRIDVRLTTSSRPGASTDGDVYLGICGREFSIDSEIDDFQEDSPPRIYTFGDGANVNFRGGNDPRSPYELLTENLDRFPVYIRFAPQARDDNWDMESVIATVNPGSQQKQYQALGGSNHLVLGTHSGLYCYLFKM